MRRMRRSLFTLAVLAAACVPAAIAAAELVSDTAPRGGGLFRSLSPEQKMMMLVDMRKATGGMTDDQRHAYRQSQRQKFAAMTETEKQQFAASLQAEWDALPDDQKAGIKRQLNAWRAMHANRGGGVQGAE